MSLDRSSLRDAAFIALIVGAALWWGRRPTDSAAALALFVALVVAGRALVRWRAIRRWPALDDRVFLSRCGAPQERETDALLVRAVMARELEVPERRLPPEATLEQIAGSVAWFGSNFLALGDLEQALKRMTNGAFTFDQGMTVREVISSILSNSTPGISDPEL
jgi:hypothetical protein